MNVKDFISHAFKAGSSWFEGMVNDIKDEPFALPTSQGGNHPLWILAHLVYSDSNLLDVFILGKENRYPEYAHCAAGSDVSMNPDDYPSPDELIARLQEIRAAALAHLETLSETDLDAGTHAPPEYAEFFGSVGACYSAMITHMAFHNGQISDIRRAAGRAPLMV